MSKEQLAKGWQSFVSLNWYDGLIEFIFRFVAKTSEPLLAAGLVISAADFLSKGALMHNNLAFALAWAWTQALAIEASSGVVFVYGLQSFKQADKIKAWSYIALSVLLALCGGAMLFLQFMNNTLGQVDSSLPVWITYTLGGLRVVVSIGYVFMCRAKHIQFSTLFHAPQQAVSTVQVQPPTVEEIVAPIIDHLDSMYSKRFEAVMERVTDRFIVSIEQVTQPRVPAIEPPKVQATKQIEQPHEPLIEDVGTKVQRYLEQQKKTGNKPTLQEIMDSTGCSKGTAIKYRKGA